MPAEFPILEFDPERKAIINPNMVYQRSDRMPKHVVVTYFKEIIEKLEKEGRLECIAEDRSELGRHPVYRLETPQGAVAVYHPGIGGPLGASLLEFAIALGGENFVVCGSAGFLVEAQINNLIIVTAAVRDEGTSYHYLPPGREVEATPSICRALQITLAEKGLPYQLGKTWTTDAIFRETPKKAKQRREEGCFAVEMEAASHFAVAQFHGVAIGQILYGSDVVVEHLWDGFSSKKGLREAIFWAAVESVLSL